jgi:ketosteroid isomerase-like protein
MGIAIDNATAGYQNFNREEFDELLARMTEDFAWHEAPEIPGRKSCANREEFARYMRGFDQLWEEFGFEPLELIESPDDALYVRVRLHGRGKASANDMELEIHHVWRLRDGLFASMHAYLDEGEARAAAGL